MRTLLKRWWFWLGAGGLAAFVAVVLVGPSPLRATANVVPPDPTSSLWRIINDKSLSYERMLRDSCQLLSKTLDGKPLAEVKQLVGRKVPNESGEYPGANEIYRRYLLKKNAYIVSAISGTTFILKWWQRRSIQNRE